MNPITRMVVVGAIGLLLMPLPSVDQFPWAEWFPPEVAAEIVKSGLPSGTENDRQPAINPTQKMKQVGSGNPGPATGPTSKNNGGNGEK